MKKIYSLLALALLFLASCGDDHDDPVIMAVMKSVNHVTNISTGDPAISVSDFYFSINPNAHTATMNGVVKLNDEQSITLQLNDLKADYDRKTMQYTLTVPGGMTQCAGHTISDFVIRIDARSLESWSNYAVMAIDGDYKLYGYLPVLLFEKTVSETSLDQGSTTTNTDGIYKISLDLDNMTANLSMEQVYRIDRINATLTFDALKLEVTPQGYHICLPDNQEPIQASGRTEKLNAIDITFTVADSKLELKDCTIAGQSGEFHIQHATGTII